MMTPLPTMLIVAAVYLALSLVTFLLYARDKSAAQAGRRRMRERTLHTLGLAGGWPGAWLAQRVLRHKTGKRRFQLAFRMTVLLNCGALAWLASPFCADMRALLGRVV